MVNRELDKYIKDFQSGNDEAFDVIYEETKKLVYLSIYPIIKSNSLTEDLMQDAYLKAITSLDSYKIGTSFKSWLCKIAHNLAIDEYNRRKKIGNLEDIDVAEIEEKTSETTMLDTAYEILNRDAIPNEKEIFTYRIIFDMDFKQISSVLDLPKSTVFNIYKRVIEKIKQNI